MRGLLPVAVVTIWVALTGVTGVAQPPIPIRMILDSPQAYAGKTVTVSGLVKEGWDASAGPPGQSPSFHIAEFTLTDVTGTITVRAGLAPPPGSVRAITGVVEVQGSQPAIVIPGAASMNPSAVQGMRQIQHTVERAVWLRLLEQAAAIVLAIAVLAGIVVAIVGRRSRTGAP